MTETLGLLNKCSRNKMSKTKTKNTQQKRWKHDHEPEIWVQAGSQNKREWSHISIDLSQERCIARARARETERESFLVIKLETEIRHYIRPLPFLARNGSIRWLLDFLWEDCPSNPKKKKNVSLGTVSSSQNPNAVNTFHISIKDNLWIHFIYQSRTVSFGLGALRRKSRGPGITGWLPDARPEAQFKVACAFPGAILTRRQIGRSKQAKPALTARNHSRPMLEMRSLGSEFSGVVVVILWLGLDVTPSLSVVRGGATGTIKQVKRPEGVWILSSCLCLSPSVCLCLPASFNLCRCVGL